MAKQKYIFFQSFHVYPSFSGFFFTPSKAERTDDNGRKGQNEKKRRPRDWMTAQMTDVTYRYCISDTLFTFDFNLRMESSLI